MHSIRYLDFIGGYPKSIVVDFIVDLINKV